jgi:hypothetical protein
MSEPNATIRASAWGELFDCAYRYEGRHMLGMRMPASSAAVLGTAIHASTAAFDQSRVDGSELTVHDTADILVDKLTNPEDDVVWEEPRQALEKIGLALHNDYCRNWSPRYEYVAVELTAKPLDVEVDGFVVRLTGTLDRARAAKNEGGTGYGIKDVKTGKRAVDKDGVANTQYHGAQVGVYELLFEHTTGLQITEPAEIIGMKTAGDFAIGTGRIPNAKRQIIGWPDQPGLLEMGARMLKAGLFPPNPRSQLCSPKFCPRWASCAYHD